MKAMLARGLALTAIISALGLVYAQSPPTTGKPVQVRITDDRPSVFEAVLPLETIKRIQYQAQPGLGVRLTSEGKTLHLGYIYTFFHIDGQVQYVGNDGRLGRIGIGGGKKLPKTPGGRERDGYMTEYNHGRIKVTQIVEVAPSKNAVNGKRRLDSCIVRYLVENNDDRPHKLGMRVGMDVYIATNDGALFASPTTHPGKILDGVELKDKAVPDYIQALERPDLNSPGFVAHYTFNLGNKLERPTRVILTSLGAPSIDGYNLQPIQAMGDSAMSMYWDVKEIPAKGKRAMAYAYGAGIASSPENEGNVKVDFSGSFEPGKVFTIRAYVADPAPGQSLHLELPAGMERMEGREIQPVPAMDSDGNCMVLWKARVQKLGQYPIRVRSTTGVTQTKIVTISGN